MRRYAALIAVMIPVLLVIGVAVSNLREAYNRSRQKRTMADMRTIGVVLEAFATDRKSYAIGARPVSATAGELAFMTPVSLDEVESAVRPRYIRGPIPRLDGWGHPFEVRLSERSYAIRAPAGDGRFETDAYVHGTTSSFEEDVVFADGSWIRYPEGL